MILNQDEDSISVPQVLKEISDPILLYSFAWGSFGAFFVLIDLLLNHIQPGSSTFIGLLLLVAALLLAILARAFRAQKRWTYGFVYWLTATLWGLRIAYKRENRQKLRNPKVREAFGLAPLPTQRIE